MNTFFKLKENNTDVKTEIVAGITTFMTMSYILAVNPLILGETGMDMGGVFTATALSAVIGTMVMALYAKYPFGLAPGMGLNAFFAYTVVLGDMGKSWQFALTAILIEGIIFVILSFFNVREAIFNSIPTSLKNAVSVGIGLFIAFLGLDNAGIIQTGDGTLLGLGDLTAAAPLLAIFGIILTGFLFSKNIKGALLIGILISTLLGIPSGVTQTPENLASLISLPPSVSDVAFQFVGFEEIFSWDMLIVIFTFLFVDIFDTVGTLAGVASKANLLDNKGKLPRVNKALMADAIGTISGACLGTSTVTTFVESASGVAEGGRTGLTALSTATMFALSLFFAPIFIMIPAAATASALVIVGLFMMSPIKAIDLDDYTEAIPAFLTIIMMPFSNSIAEGIVFGMISYTLLKGMTGKFKDISWTMLAISALFLIRIFFM
ncbi:MAG: NCS2 family permease [Atopostipes suicloacalis]|nr:NCS2 family permease [Atopostipes suicloacalis]